MRTNVAVARPQSYTHEGAKAVHIKPEQMLRRSVLSCLLGEDEFYESGVLIKQRIKTLATQVDPATVAVIADEARTKYNLRHAPLALTAGLIARGSKELPKGLVRQTINSVVKRADEIAELVAMLWSVEEDYGRTTKIVRSPLPGQVKKGLADRFLAFDEYQLKKYANRDGAIKLRDVMFLTHPKPRNEQQKLLFQKLADNDLKSADTWEVALSSGQDKGETFTRLLQEGKLGYMALLRNLRNMEQANVDRDLIERAIIERKGAWKVFPFRYIAAARAAPSFVRALDDALKAAVKDGEALSGATTVLVDVSGSMDYSMSGKSDLNRIDAAASLAGVVNSERVFAYSFSNSLVEVPAYPGLAVIDALRHSQPHGGTYLGNAIAGVMTQAKTKNSRLIVITDEQTADRLPNPQAITSHFSQIYMINVGSYKNGVGYKNGWVHLDGFSEAVLRYISEYEKFLDGVDRVS